LIGISIHGRNFDAQTGKKEGRAAMADSKFNTARSKVR